MQTEFPIIYKDDGDIEATAIFNLTDEGLIVDVWAGDELIQSWGWTAQEFIDDLTD